MNTEVKFDPILKCADVQNMTKLGRNTIYTLARNGQFPAPFKLTPNGRASGWLMSEVLAWQQERIASRLQG